MPRAVQPLRLDEIAARLGPGREVSARGDFVVRGVGPLETALPDELAFVRSPRYFAAARASRAGALILPRVGAEPGDTGELASRPSITSPSPDRDFARALSWLAPRYAVEPGVSTQAVVATDAQVDATASIGPGCVVGAGSKIGAGSVLHANVCVYPDVEIGDDCELHAGVVVREGSRIGARVRLQPSVVIGGEGFGLAYGDDGAPQAIPQLGRVVIEDDVEIGANSAVDRASLGETRIGRGSKIDDLVMVAHNVQIGAFSVIAAQSGLAGSARIGERVIVMAQVGVGDHVEIGDESFVGSRAGVAADIPEKSRVWGFPALAGSAWHRQVAALARLPAALKRLRRLERRVDVIDDEDTSGQDEAR